MKKGEVLGTVRSSMIKAPKDYEWAVTTTPETTAPEDFRITISLVKKQ